MPATLLRDFWYVIARRGDLARGPVARRLMGRDLVVFRDDRGRARVLDAVCPHRGANLALGRVVRGQLECPYHGWRFDGDGQCARIPASRERRVPAGYAAECFPVMEQQGLIWTSLGTPVAAPPNFAGLDDPGFETFCAEVAGPVTLDWWVENALDFAHLPFVHPKTIGDAETIVDEFDIQRRDDHMGFVAHAARRPDYSILGRLMKIDTQVTVELTMPSHAFFDVDLGKGRRQIIIALATPEDDHSIRTWNFSIRNYLRLPFANAIGQLLLRQVLREDFGEAGRSLAPISLARDRMLSSRADELSLEFLRLLKWWRAKELPVISSGPARAR